MSVDVMDKRFVRKVNQTGNSLSVGIPKDVADLLNMKKGDDLELVYNEERGEIVIKKLEVMENLFNGINPKVLKSMNKVMGQYKDMFENLKDR